MTHILKPGLFECHDMWHHHEAPRMQCNTSWVNERPKFRGFVQAGWTGNMGRVWLRGRKEGGGSIESKKPTSWGWDILKGRGCHKRVWGLKPESGDTEVENKGQAWVESDSWRRDTVLWRAAMPCCSKELSPFLSVSLLCLFPFFSPSARVRLSKDAERQTADRAVTITPFRSIQTFWGGECRGERKKGGR